MSERKLRSEVTVVLCVIYLLGCNGENYVTKDMAHLPDPPEVEIIGQTTNTITINITAPPLQTITKYQVRYCKFSYFIKGSSSSTIYTTPSNIVPGSAYRFYVASFVDGVKSANETNVTAYSVPFPPTRVKVVNQRTTEISLSVRPGAWNYEYFCVEFFKIPYPELMKNKCGKNGSMSLTGLLPGTLYNVSVFMRTHLLRSSKLRFDGMKIATVPSSPLNVKISGCTSSSINLTVTPGTGSYDGFKVTYFNTRDHENIAQMTYITTDISIAALDPGSEYNVSVITIANDLQSTESVYADHLAVTHKRSRSAIEETTPVNEALLDTSTSIGNVDIQDGPLRACYLKTCFNTSAIHIHRLPEVRINPVVLSVEDGGKVTLTCTITRYEDENDIEFIWTFNGFTNESTLSGVPVTTNETSVLQLVDLTLHNSGNYVCSVMVYNIKDTISLTSTSTIYVLSKDVKTCPNITDERGLEWPLTPVGTQLTLPCPNTFTGNVTRDCMQDGLWGKVNYINCVRTQINNALEQVIGIKDGLIHADEIHNVLQSIAEVTSATNETRLTSGDLSKTSLVLSELVDVIDDSQTSPNLTKNFVDIVDNMLSPVNRDTWIDVTKQSTSTDVSDIMDTVEKLGNIVGKNLSVASPIVVERSNIVVEIKRIQDNDIHSNLNTSTNDSYFQNQIALNLGSGTTGDVTYTAVLYSTIGKILPNNTNVLTGYPSEVLGLSIVHGYSSSRHLPSNISLTFDIEKLRSENNLTGNVNIKCVFWNFNKAAGPIGWSDIGCSWSSQRNACLCNHLTNFAVLMSPIQISNEIDIARLRIITLAGCSLSILSTAITMVVYALLWRYIKNDRSVLVLNMCVAVTAGYALFLGGLDRTDDNVLCTVVAALLHFFFLAIFCLMLADGIQLLRRTTVVMNVKSILKWLLLIGWGLPAIIVGITIGIKHDGGYHSKTYCWLTLTDGVLYSFVGPVLVIILVNVAVMILVLKALLTSQFIMTKSQKQKVVSAVRSVCVLLPVLGITWFFGILSINDDLIVFQYLFAATNSLQGFFIFLFHCVLSVPVRRAIEQKYRKSVSKSYQSQGTLTTRSSRNSTDNIIDESRQRGKKTSSPQPSQHTTKFLHLNQQYTINSPL
ncbi:adhesion G protein-coupled receptor B1-like isoform X2 [Argopecten irradians]|uniref:adhesion G protein-coupled receptor B1-like isoform X2 n=1 Tax=Argopecten irradians TaxID=31199 RepID=UPI00371CA514